MPKCMACRCCTDQNLQRSVAVEVKSIATDAGRTKFVHLLRYTIVTQKTAIWQILCNAFCFVVPGWRVRMIKRGTDLSGMLQLLFVIFTVSYNPYST